MTTLILHFLLFQELLLPHEQATCVLFIVHTYRSKKHPGEDLGRASDEMLDLDSLKKSE